MSHQVALTAQNMGDLQTNPISGRNGIKAKIMTKKILIIFVFGIHFILNGQANNETDSIQALPFENVNIITDRDLYLSGETIWFQASISLENNHDAVSNILYLELFNTKQRSIIKKKYKINQGFAEGVLDIPAEFLSDVYYLRAYTHYNKNFPVERYFISAIQIINPKKGILAKAETKDLDEISERPISNFSIKSLPQKEGLQIASVYKSKENSENNNEIYSLDLLDYKQQIISTAEFSLSSHSAVIAFSDSTFEDSGLYYYLLKDQDDKILKVHAFVHKEFPKTNSKSKVAIREFKKRDLVSIDLVKYAPQDYSNYGIKIAKKGCILSTTDKLKLFMEDPYLLMSYLKTQFNPLDLKTKEEALSLLALNKKLNMEEYKSLFNSVNVYEQKWIPGLKDIGLSGVAVDKLSQESLSNVPIYLSFFDEQPEIHVTLSKDDGSFQFSLNSFENYKDALLCPLYKRKDEIELKVNREFIPIFQDFKSISLPIESTDIDLLEQMLISSQTTKNSKLRSIQQDFKIRNLPYSFDDPDISVVLDDYVETPTMKMVFKELVSGVRVRKRKDKYSISVFDTIRGSLYTNPLILIDDIPVFDIEALLKIPPKAIEKIEVHSSPFIMESHIIYGIVNISTLSDNFGGMNMHESSSFFKYQTISPNYTYPTKSYKSEEELSSRKGDFRTLLYWNPFIQENTDSLLNFYTSDQTGDYETYIFGIYKNGQAFHLKLFDLKVIE